VSKENVGPNKKGSRKKEIKKREEKGKVGVTNG